MTKVKCIVFDADGTLLNSRELIVEAYQHIAREHGLPEPSAQDVRDQLAMSLTIPQILENLFPGHDSAELLETNTKFMGARHLEMPAYEGLHDLLRALEAVGLKMAIFTGGGKAIQDILNNHSVSRYFSSVVYADRLAKAKPDPEGFLLAVSESGVLPGEAIMVGDSKNDILSGKNGKALATVGITHGNGSREQLEAAGADYIIDSLSELPDILAIIG